MFNSQIADITPIATHRRAVIATAQSECRRWEDAKRNVKLALQLQFFAEDMEGCFQMAFGNKTREEIVHQAQANDFAEVLIAETIFLRKQNAHLIKWAKEEFFFAHLAQSSDYGYSAVKHFEGEAYLEGDDDLRAKFQKARKETAKEMRGRGQQRGAGSRRGRGGYNNVGFSKPRGNFNFIRGGGQPKFCESDV